VTSSSNFDPSGLINLSSTTNFSGDSSNNSLKLLSVKSVTSSGNRYDVTATIDGDSITFSTQSKVPEGSTLLGKIKAFENSYKLKVLSNTHEIEQVKTQSLMNLLRKSGINLEGRDPKTVQKTLSQKGYLPPASAGQGPTGSSTAGPKSMAGQTLPITSASESALEDMSSGSIDQASVVSTGDGKATLNINGNNLTVRAPSSLQKGMSFPVKLTSTGSDPALTIQPAQTAGQPVKDLQSISRQQLSQLLRQMGFEPDDQALKAARSILETDPSPSKKTLRQSLENLQLTKGSQGTVDSNRLKSLLFLAKNDLPIKSESIDLLRHAVPSGDNSGSGNAFNQLQQAVSGESGKNSSLGDTLQAVNLTPSASGSSEDRAQELFQAVKSMGFDLESQVPCQPEGASKTLRSQLMKLQQFFGDSATESIRQSMQSGVESGLQDQSRELLSQLFKYSLASVSEDNSIFLFVPFPDGDQTGMMRLRFEQDGDGEELNNEKWNVTIHLDLNQLGPLQIQAQRHREKLNLTFKAAIDRTVNIIQQREENLGDIFVEKGFNISVTTKPWNQDEEPIVDWDLYFDKGDSGGTFDFTI
jgi:hypothetical protein